MKKFKTQGYINGILAAISYGTNPLFALPMYKMGMNVNSVLFYRYLFAVIIYGAGLKLFKKTNFKLSVKEFISLFFTAVLFALSSVTLFSSFKYIDSGIACTMLFIYPVIVALISTIFFKEKLSKTSIFAMIIAIYGIFMLNGGIKGYLNPKGIILVLLSALVYAVYIVLVKNLSAIKHMKHDKLSFYVMLMGLSVFVINLKFCTLLQPINDLRVLACALALAVFPTIISLETINIAIRLIGPTTTAVLGALEPLTAIFFGVMCFGEVLKPDNIIGIFLIIFGVMLIILRDRFK
ncbi:MAG: DMT family transporter [Candidatus Avigastranaerophilus sp.]